MEETNFIGLVLSTLEEAGIDTTDLTVEEAIEKYNELINENAEYEEYEDVSVEEVAEEVNEEPEDIVDEPIEEVAEEAEAEEQAEEEVREDIAEENAVEEEVADAEISDEEFARIVAEYKAEIVAFLKEKGII